MHDLQVTLVPCANCPDRSVCADGCVVLKGLAEPWRRTVVADFLGELSPALGTVLTRLDDELLNEFVQLIVERSLGRLDEQRLEDWYKRSRLKLLGCRTDRDA